MKNIITSLFIVFLFPPTVYAQCWVFSNLKGYSSFADTKFKFEKNGHTDGITLSIDKNGDVYFGSLNHNISNLTYIATSPTSAIGVFNEGNIYTVETITVNVNKVLYTKVVNDKRDFVNLTGVHSFVGDATPCVRNNK